MRFLIVAARVLAVLLPTLCFGAEPSLHQAQPGTVVEGRFVLSGKVFPLPQGKFVLLAGYEAQTRNQPTGSMLRATSNIANAVLAQTEGTALRIMVWARANVDGSRTRWTDEPCKRTDTLYRLDREKSFNYRQDCVLINHRVQVLRNPSGRWLDVHNRLASEGIALPIPVVLEASVVRIDEFQYFGVTYWVNPAAFAFKPGNEKSWTTSAWHKSTIANDPQKSAFAKSLADWAVGLQPAVERGFQGKPPLESEIPALRLVNFSPD